MVMPMTARRATAAPTGIAFGLAHRVVTLGHSRAVPTGRSLVLGGKGFWATPGKFFQSTKIFDWPLKGSKTAG